MKSNLLKKRAFFLLFLFFILINGCSKKQEYTFLKGEVFGTYYTITYYDKNGENYQKEIENLLQQFDNSLSTYNPNSIISKINRNEKSVTVDSFFVKMFNVAEQVYNQTNGAFDITVAPVVNAWGFGFQNKDSLSNSKLEQLQKLVGFDKIKLVNHQIKKSNPAILLDASAIAKGQGSDVVASFLSRKGIENYMVEIGGEIVTRGVNPKNEAWKIGIDKPYEDPANLNNEIQQIVKISNVGMATSGNYRQFYYKNGKKYAHTIDPRTGYPTSHNLLSATVIAQDCITADAYATAFMVLGIDSALSICNQIADIECFLIYENKNKKIATRQSKGFEKYVVTQ